MDTASVQRRLELLIARTPHAATCRWHATGGQRCSCGLHALVTDVRSDLATALTRAEVAELRVEALERGTATPALDGRGEPCDARR